MTERPENPNMSKEMAAMIHDPPYAPITNAEAAIRDAEALEAERVADMARMRAALQKLNDGR